MAEIAAATFNTYVATAQLDSRRGDDGDHDLSADRNRSTELWDLLEVIDKRLNDKGKNWRHVLKSLKVLDYCLHEGSELVVTWARQNIYLIKTLREFQYIEEDGRDVGQNGTLISICAVMTTLAHTLSQFESQPRNSPH